MRLPGQSLVPRVPYLWHEWTLPMCRLTGLFRRLTAYSAHTRHTGHPEKRAQYAEYVPSMMTYDARLDAPVNRQYNIDPGPIPSRQAVAPIRSFARLSVSRVNPAVRPMFKMSGLSAAAVAVWAASPCLPRIPRFVASGRKRPSRVTSKKVVARKWRPTFFLLPGVKKVSRHKSCQINGLC